MKRERDILTVEIDPETREFLEKRAKEKDVTVSKLVRAAIKKTFKIKEKQLI